PTTSSNDQLWTIDLFTGAQTFVGPLGAPANFQLGIAGLATGTNASGMPFCFGDGSGAACPCANNGSNGNGCANSVNAAGANLTASGAASVSADTLVLLGRDAGR